MECRLLKKVIKLITTMWCVLYLTVSNPSNMIKSVWAVVYTVLVRKRDED
jgi:hypothetical protein